MNLNMNLIFENLFKSESITPNGGGGGSMTPIYEETTPTTTGGQQPTESRYGTLRPFRSRKQQHSRLGGRNTISGPHGGSISSTPSPTDDDNNPILTSRRNSIVGFEVLGGGSGGGGDFSDPLVCHFERSGSTKSYIKNKGPFSRLWQMRRRSFSQFELSSVGLTNNGNKVLGSSSGHLNLLDFDECDTPGVFHPIGDHWVSETELPQSGALLNKQEDSGGGGGGGNSGAGAEQLDRASVNVSSSTDDYGFLPVQGLHHGLSTVDGSKVQGGKVKKDGAPSALSDCDEESDPPRDLFPPSLPRTNLSRPLNPNRWSSSRGRGNLGNGTNKNSTHHPNALVASSSAGGNSKRSSKLKRRKAYYRDKKEGRSRSLTHIDNLDPAMLLRNEDMDSKSEPDTSQDQLLFVPGPTENSRDSRRKKLARSQVSSSEFFSVCFEGELGSGLEEFLPATRGTCLGEALRPLCDKKNIDLASVNVYVDSSKTPLPAAAHTDTYFVAGKNLIVRAKEADSKFHTRSFKQPSRKSSQRGKHKFFSVSTEDANYSGTGTTPATATFDNSSLSIGGGGSTSSLGGAVGSGPAWQPGSHSGAVGLISHEGSLKVKNTTKQTNRWSGLFSNSKDNSKMDLLVEQLNTYSKNGIPKPNILSCDTDDIQLSYCPEEDWKAIVGGSMTSEMSERARQQQTAIWELVETEVVYLKTIRVITDLFLACLYNLQSANILNEIDRDQLFSNVTSISAANKVLWLDCILPMVEKAREMKTPLQPQELRNGFLKFGSTCQPYTRYCLDQTKCQQYCREKYQENELFKAYLAWCETRKECNRLRLMDILVRPMQRMTKYALLLRAILRHTEDPEQRRCLEEMITSVERFVKSVNGTLRSRQDAERLQAIAERIECYDVVETREDELESIVKSHSKLDLFHPMPGCRTSKRWLLFEGDLKIKDSLTSKMDVHCFLFTDMLLICKPMGRKGEKMKVIRQPLIVDRLVCREFSKDTSALGLVYLNEYGTTVAALSFHTNNEPKLIRQWLEHIRKAQKLYKETKEKSHEPADYTGEGEEDEGTSMMYLSSRSPRGGSSRASQSRCSSLVHSHSGSIEMNEVSAISSRAVSFEQELRGSSLSSDDGNAVDPPGVSPKSRSLSTDTSGGPLRPTSPNRRLFFSKSPTPNTLTVQIPVPNLSGQSLPNLRDFSDTSPPTYAVHHHSLTVPKSLLSPTQRGVSYPPPSPRSLRRSHALLQSRNPPLQKAKNIVSPENHAAVEKCASLDVQVPEIRGVIPPSNDVSPVAPPQSSFSQTHPHTHPHHPLPPPPVTSVVSPSSQLVDDESSNICGAGPEGYNFDAEDEVLIVHSNPAEHVPVPEKSHMQEYVDYYAGSGSCSSSEPQSYGRDSGCEGMAKGEVGIMTTCFSKRLARNERSDTKRYHTAGAIEDIKKENCRDKDAAIHKRLSWNYGPQQLQHHTTPNMHSEVLKNRQFFSSESMGSVRSSSGVSSTSSLLHCISHSDLETTLEGAEPPRDARLPDVLIAVSEPDPDLSDRVCNFCESDREAKSRCSSNSDGICPLSPAPSTCSSSCPNKEDNLVGLPSASSCPGYTATSRTQNKPTTIGTGGVIIMKDFILTDASIEASEV